MLKLAHDRIKKSPDRYYPEVIGEHIAGGTSWLMLSDRPATEIGLHDLPDTSPAVITETIQHGIFKGFTGPIMLFGLISVIMKSAGKRPDVSLLGAVFEADRRAGRYRIAKIYRGHNAEPKYRSPLTEVGIGVSVGDYVLAIDGRELTLDENPYELLTDRGKQPVELTVNDGPRSEGARRVLAEPIGSEGSLAYLDWVLDNQAYVSERTDGRVGYLHIPDMGANGIYEFIKWYFPQLRKEGLIIDVRFNGGGSTTDQKSGWGRSRWRIGCRR